MFEEIIASNEIKFYEFIKKYKSQGESLLTI